MRIHPLVFVLGVTALGASGCLLGDGDAGNTRAVTLNLAVKRTENPIARAAPDQLELSRARILLREIELERADEDDIEDLEEFEAGPLVVDLPLDGTVEEIVVARVPAALYDEIEFEMEGLDPSAEADAAAIASDLTGRFDDFLGEDRFTVIVDGTVDGEPFVYRSRVEGEKEIPLNDPVVVSQTTDIHLTLTIDLDAWFRDSAGNLVDPRAVENAELIEQNIQESFEGFEDNDRDGDNDDVEDDD
jgi:hypothetical protein